MSYEAVIRELLLQTQQSLRVCAEVKRANNPKKSQLGRWKGMDEDQSDDQVWKTVSSVLVSEASVNVVPLLPEGLPYL